MARRSTEFWIFIALLAFAHFTVRVALGLGAGTPDMLTVAALLGARRLRPPLAALVGFGLGLIEDGLALTAFGATAFALTVTSYVGARSRDLFEGESVLFLGVYLFLGKWVRDAIIFGLTFRIGRGDAVSNLLIDGPLAALITAVAGIVGYLLYRAVTGER